jgi:hypothetical protein
VVAAARTNQELIAIMCMVHVLLGLLLRSVSAATSLAEERVRGSLDVLLCTPLRSSGGRIPSHHLGLVSRLAHGVVAVQGGLGGPLRACQKALAP